MAPVAHRADARRGRIEDGPAAVVDADLAPPACDQPPLPAPISRASTAALAPHRHQSHHPPQWRAHSLSENPNTYNASLHRSNRQHGHVSSTTWELLLPVEDIANRWCHHPQELLVSSLATLGMQTMGAAVLGTLPQRLWQHARAEPQAGRARRARAAPPASTGDEHAEPGNLQAQGAHRRRPNQRGADATSEAQPPSSPHTLPETRSQQPAPRCQRPRSGWYRPRRHARPLGNGSLDAARASTRGARVVLGTPPTTARYCGWPCDASWHADISDSLRLLYLSVDCCISLLAVSSARRYSSRRICQPSLVPAGRARD